MRFQKYRDVIFGVAAIVFGALYLYANSLTKLKMSTTFINARFVPMILGILMLLLGALILISAVRKLKEFDPAKVSGEKNDAITILLTFALIVVYVAVMRQVGFLLSSIVYLFLQMTVLAPKEKRNLVLFACVSVAFTALVYFSFRYGLDLMLPQGIINL